MRCHDALIIGGGPAGATAAIVLARAGCRVAVLEKAPFPRQKVCGEFMAPAGIDRLRALGLGERFDATAGPEIRRVEIWTGKRAIATALPRRRQGAPFPRALARETLDPLLLGHAARCGAEVLQPARPLALRTVAGGFICLAAARPGAQPFEIHARAIIAAHGSWEPGPLCTQPPRLAPAGDDLLAFKAHLQGGLPPHSIVLAPFPGGYAGLLDRGGGQVTYACCIRRDALAHSRRAGMPPGESLALQLGIPLERQSAWRAAGPLRPGRRPLFRDGIFAIGNAAGEPHSVVGEGMAMAMHSAMLLCAPLAAAFASGYSREAASGVARRYARAWQRHIAWRLWLSARFAALAMQPDSAAARWITQAPVMLRLAARFK